MREQGCPATALRFHLAEHFVLLMLLTAAFCSPARAQLPSCAGNPPPPPFELDFNTYPDGSDVGGGDFLENQWQASHGIRISTLSAFRPMAFNTAAPTGGDPDLGAPNNTCPGGGPGEGSGGVYIAPPAPPNPFENCAPLGMTLIISEDNDATDPDDKFDGGTIVFQFAVPVTVKSVDVLDIEGTVTEPDVTISFLDDETGGNQVPGSPIVIPPTGNNGYEIRDVSISGVRRMEAVMLGSGSFPRLTLCADGGLPVELSQFTATATGREVLLNWSTDSEQNNSGFEIQHALGGDTFTPIGFVPGAGSSVDHRLYQYRTYEMPYGRHRFRLLQVDMDGEPTTGGEVEIAIEMPSAIVLDPIFPNPFERSTTITFASRSGGPVALELFSPLGKREKILFRGTVTPGVSHTVQLDGQGLTSGLYLVRLATRDQVDTRSVHLLR